jgi:hypothetical protein
VIKIVKARIKKCLAQFLKSKQNLRHFTGCKDILYHLDIKTEGEQEDFRQTKCSGNEYLDGIKLNSLPT